MLQLSYHAPVEIYGLSRYEVVQVECSPRVVQGHMAAKREAVRQLPRLWCLKRLLGLAEVTPQKTEPAMVHLSTAHTSGTPAAFTPPPGNLYINLNHPYLRQAPQQSSAEVASTPSGQQRRCNAL